MSPEASRPATIDVAVGPRTLVSTRVPDPRVVRILGVPFHDLTYPEAKRHIAAMLRGPGVHHIVLANAHTLNCAVDDAGYRSILQQANLVLRDGVGIELAAMLAGRRLRNNFVGTDFVPALLRSLAQPRVRVFLYGASAGVAVTAGRELVKRCAGIQIVGAEHGYGDAREVLSAIRAQRADVLLVALGNPLQERWIATHLDELQVPVAIGVGALFDYLAGRVVRAPRWIRRLRSEWIFRLCVEPGRLWRRYLAGNARFLWRVLADRRQPAST